MVCGTLMSYTYDFHCRLIPLFTAKNVRRSQKSAEAELRNLVSSSQEAPEDGDPPGR